MKTHKLPIHSYQHRSTKVGNDRLVNMYAEQSPPDGKAPYSVSRIPGIVDAITLSGTKGRGLYRWQGQLFAVSDIYFYKISSSHTATLYGNIIGTDLVSFAETPTQLVICSASATYVFDGTTLTQVTDPDFEDGAQCCSIDGYVLFRKEGTGQFFSSDLNNALSYDALMFATAEGLADNIVGIVADHRQAILGGSDSMEIWYNAGIAGFPFIRDSNGFIELGVASGKSMCKVDNTVFWLASDKTVRKLESLTPVRISTHGVEQAIKTYTTDDAFGFGYTDGGHLFYVITFPTDNATWVYDATTQLWAERSSYGFGRWRVNSMALAYGKWYAQDATTGKVGYLSDSTYDDFGNTQLLLANLSDIYSDGELITHDKLELVVEVGAGTVDGYGYDPLLTLERSDDSGKTWVTLPTRSLGKMGEYKTRVKWDALGAARYRQYRLSFSAPVKFSIADIVLEVS